MEKEDAIKLAQQIKAKVDMLVDNHGIAAIKPLEDIKSMDSWIILKEEAPHTILLVMNMYIDGVIRTLYRENK